MAHIVEGETQYECNMDEKQCHPGPGAGDPDQVETGLIFVQEVFALQGWPGSAGAFEPPHAGIDRLARHSPHDGGKSRRPSVGG